MHILRPTRHHLRARVPLELARLNRPPQLGERVGVFPPKPLKRLLLAPMDRNGGGMEKGIAAQEHRHRRLGVPLVIRHPSSAELQKGSNAGTTIGVQLQTGHRCVRRQHDVSKPKERVALRSKVTRFTRVKFRRGTVAY